jgi:transposase
MPLEEIIIGIAGFKTINCYEEDRNIIIKAKYTIKPRCPYCGSRTLRIKDSFIRRVRHGTILSRNSLLEFEARKYFCFRCDKYFNERFHGILPYKRSTEKFRKEVFQDHQDGICQSTLRNRLKISSSTVERWSHDFLKFKASMNNNNPCPIVLGIDEHFFTKKDGYATTICDLKNKKVCDVVLGRSEEALGSYMSSLRNKENVKAVVMDLSDTYRRIIKKHFCKAKIVADRFHVIRLINYHFLKVWQQIDPKGRKSRGLLSLMRRHEHNLTPKQKIKLEAYFNSILPMKGIYAFKQELCMLMLNKKINKKEAKVLIPKFLNMINELKYCKLDPMVTLGNTLESWNEEIVRMWRFTRTNSITEGFHTKMEMISRRAFGFRNFENYRLRVRALCA